MDRTGLKNKLCLGGKVRYWGEVQGTTFMGYE